MTETADPPSGPYAPFAYATAPNAALYRRIMLAFVRAKERFTVHLRPEDLRSALDDDDGAPVTEAAVAAALDALAAPAWGNLVAFPDSSRVTAIEDFYRRRMLYQLSHAGEAAERALRQYDDSLGTRGALQAVALEDIAILLRSLLGAAHAASPAAPLDEARIHQDLRSLRDRFTELADNAVVFMGSVQRSIDLQSADLDAFLAYKDRLIGYLERFIADLVTRVPLGPGACGGDGGARRSDRGGGGRLAAGRRPPRLWSGSERWARTSGPKLGVVTHEWRPSPRPAHATRRGQRDRCATPRPRLAAACAAARARPRGSPPAPLRSANVHPG